MYDVATIRADFPILARQVNGKPLVYLDNGASAQKPQVVIDAVTRAYAHEYANVHRGLHYLSNLATEKYEATRGIVARFLNAASEEEIVFTTGTTEGINLVSYAWAAPRLQAGDEIVLSVMEHHANIVPWHFLRERQGVVLKWVEVDANGDLDPQAVINAIGPKTKLVAVTHMSNVLGTVVDVAAICRGAREKGVPVMVDGSQAAVHMPVDVQAIGCDFYAITGHKLYGRDLDFTRPPGRDAALPWRWRHDPRGHARRRNLERPADEVRGGDAGHRAADRAWRGAGVPHGPWHAECRGA
jgi:cysteine desulfurase / selenocysteine lyase